MAACALANTDVEKWVGLISLVVPAWVRWWAGLVDEDQFLSCLLQSGLHLGRGVTGGKNMGENFMGGRM